MPYKNCMTPIGYLHRKQLSSESNFYDCGKSGGKEYIQANVRLGTIPRLSRSTIERIAIPLPPLPVQSEIVRILDKFTKATTELSSLLSTELAARRRQYEFYRDKLLSFKRRES